MVNRRGEGEALGLLVALFFVGIIIWAVVAADAKAARAYKSGYMSGCYDPKIFR